MLDPIEAGPYSANGQGVFQYIRNNIDEDDNIVFWKPRVLSYLTNRRSALVFTLDELTNGKYDYVLVLLVEYSDDGGNTWSAGSWPRVGRLGEFTLQVEFFNLGTFYDRIFRVSTTDPVNYSIYSATIDLRLAGK